MDVHTVFGNEICPDFYTRKKPFTRFTPSPLPLDASPAVVWCYTPDKDPMPLLRSLIRWVSSQKGATAYILCEDRVGSSAHTCLRQYPICHVFPSKSALFSVPVSTGKHRVFVPAPLTIIRHNVYKVSYDPSAVIAEKLSKMNIGQDQYIFKVRIGRLSVRANTHYKSHILSAAQLEALEADFVGARQNLALGDTGATNSLITKQAAHQIRAFVDTRHSGHVILGDNISTVDLLGTCSFEITVGAFVSRMTAYVIDADWGTAQQVVIGGDWIEEHGAMLGAADGLGPQLTVHGHTVYAKERTQPYLSSHVRVPVLSAFQFKSVIEGTAEEGQPWTAVDVTEDGVMHSGQARVPLNEFLSKGQYCEYLGRLQASRVLLASMQSGGPDMLPQDNHSEPLPKKPPKPAVYDPALYTSGGVTLASLEALKSDFPTVFRADLPDRHDGSEPHVHSESIHTINLLPNAKPSFRKAWRTSPAERAEIDKQVAYMLAKGLIKPSSSPWGAPTLFAPKSDGSLRMCVDYRGLNAVTERDVYPLPRVDDVYAAIKGKKVFSTLDLLKGYWQIGIQPCDRHLTAFTTPTGLYESTVLTFGLTNAPATFQRFMNKIFHDMVSSKQVVVYLDDILVMGKDVKEHDKVLREVLSRLSAQNLIVRFDKCTFGAETLPFLGFVIGKGQIAVDEKKIQAVQNWPVPTNVTELRGFLGLANYLRKFMPGYAVISSPLTAATGSKKKGAPLTMTGSQLEAFNAIKAMLTSPPVLAVEDPARPYEVITDASGLGIGAVLLQRDDEGNPRVVAYESKAFASKGDAVKAQFDAEGTAGQRPSGLDEASLEDASGKQELAALIHALKIWRCNLEGADFTVYTDHNPLVHLLTKKDLNRWQVRILDTLATYPGLRIEHIPGVTNIADGLSRIDHKIAKLAEMPHTPKEPGVALERSFLNAMETWPALPADTERELPRHKASDDTILSHENTYNDCVHTVTMLFASTLALHDVGKANSTRSKTAGHTPPTSTGPAVVKRTKLVGTPPPVEIPPDTVRPPVDVDEIVDAPQAVALPTLAGVLSGNLAVDFLSKCKDGYVRHKQSATLLENARGPSWVLQSGLWYYEQALYVPDHYNIRMDCISMYHDAPSQGHPSAHRTLEAVRRFYYWPTICADVQEYVDTCDSCQRHKKSSQLPAGLLQATPVPSLLEKGRHWIVDFATKLPTTASGHCEIMVMKSTDKFTFLRECAVGMGAQGAADMFLATVRVFGNPISFRGDRDSRFTAEVFAKTLADVGCSVHLASVDHHESVGLAERSIRHIKETLRHFINPSHTNWRELLHPIEHALNNGFCAALGTTPSYYMFGTYPDAPPEGTFITSSAVQRAKWAQVVARAHMFLEQAQQRVIASANKKRRDVVFRVGDNVLLSTKHPWFQTLDGVKKFIPAWSGPFRILEVVHNTSFVLDLPEDINTYNRFHASLLKHYHPRTRVTVPPSPEEIDGHDYYEVEEIVNHRTKTVGRAEVEEYRVSFTGYGPYRSKWIPAENLSCPDLVAEYHARRHGGVGSRAIAGTLCSILFLFLVLCLVLFVLTLVFFM